MSRILITVILLIVSQIATSQETSRQSRTYSNGIKETVVSSTTQPQDDPLGKRAVATKITADNESQLVRGEIKQPLAAFVMIEVVLDSKGNLISSKPDREGYVKGYATRVLEMVRAAAPFKVPDYYKGGRFLVNIAFDYDGNFKMQEFDK